MSQDVIDHAPRNLDDLEAFMAAFREAIELADEGWAYASDYFVRKWQFIERRNKLAALVGLDPITEERQ